MQGITSISGEPHALPRGTLLQGGRYRIEQTLGYGGFAITYLAHDTALNRPVAVKELLPDGCAREPHTLTVQPQRLTADQFQYIRQRFIEEAQLLAQLNHPSIVRVYDVFAAHNTGYIVMEYLHGHTLSELLRQRGGVLPEQEAVGYILQVCDALQVVHQRGYLHRDIKPSNIIVTPEGRAVLIDFGAAREYAAGQTRAYTVMLTPTYAALEQYGATTKLDGRTDLYALGATLYHLVTGVPPLPAPDRARGIPLPAPHLIATGVSEGISRAIVHAMGLQPEDRPTSVQEWAHLLRQAISVKSSPIIPPAPPKNPPLQATNPSSGAIRNTSSFNPTKTIVTDILIILVLSWMFFMELIQYSQLKEPMASLAVPMFLAKAVSIAIAVLSSKLFHGIYAEYPLLGASIFVALPLFPVYIVLYGVSYAIETTDYTYTWSRLGLLVLPLALLWALCTKGMQDKKSSIVVSLIFCLLVFGSSLFFYEQFSSVDPLGVVALSVVGWTPVIMTWFAYKDTDENSLLAVLFLVSLVSQFALLLMFTPEYYWFFSASYAVGLLSAVLRLVKVYWIRNLVLGRETFTFLSLMLSLEIFAVSRDAEHFSGIVPNFIPLLLWILILAIRLVRRARP